MSRTREIRRCASMAAVLLALTTVHAAVQAQTPTKSTVQREHTVKKGDTLWDLAGFYYGNPFLWKIIYDANKPVVENPHWIYPVEKLIIPGRDMSAEMPLGTPVPPAIAVEVIPMALPADTTPMVLTTIDMRRPLVSAAEYSTAPWLSMDPNAAIIGRIVREADPNAKNDKIPQQLYPNKQIILGELRGTQPKPGDSVQIVRLGRRLGTHGTVVEPLGVVRIDSVGMAVLVGHIARQFGAAKVGDYIMALPAMPEIARGDLAPVEGGAEGQLVAFLQTAPLYGPGDIGFVSLGSDQVRIGDELAVYIPEQRLDNERPDRLPAQMVGVVRVVKVSDHSATVRVTGVRNTGFRNGLPARLWRRAP
ncbi:MAG: LysM peptidoglycan-binding domain-containing protein [Longimicrobiales bacterium]